MQLKLAKEVCDIFLKNFQNLLRAYLFLIVFVAAGEVFKANHSETGNTVAIKKMILNAQNMKLLITEIGIMKACQHDNIVTYMARYHHEYYYCYYV